MSLSAHPFNIGPQGPTGDAWTHPFEWNSAGLSGFAATGPKGHTGHTGGKGTTGPTGNTGSSIIGLTYSSTGPNAYRIIVQYDDVGGQAVTADGGFYRGPTGSSIYYLRGENIGHSSTGGLVFKDSVNGVLYLKSLTGGNSLRVEDSPDGKSIRIRYKTFDAVTAHGPQGALVFASKNSSGTTGLSGATLTHYYSGPTYALKMTTRTSNEVSNRLAAHEFDVDNNTFIYRINPIEALSIESAYASDWDKPSGNVIVLDPNQDYRLWFGHNPTEEQKPFVRIIDSSDTGDVETRKYSNYSSLGFTVVVIGGDTLGSRVTQNGDSIVYPFDEVFPKNWKFSYSLPPTLTSDIDIIQFITLSNPTAVDSVTGKVEWYGMYVRTKKDINPFEWG